MAQLGGQPVLILKEGAERTTGKSAQKNNIAAAKVIAEAVRTSLGPRGMDKMLVDQFGDVTITNDGATILKEIDVQKDWKELYYKSEERFNEFLSLFPSIVLRYFEYIL